jgi:hypothetical protein
MTSLPAVATDPELEPEPENLARWHANLSKLGYNCFMPKSEQEMDVVLAKKDDLFVTPYCCGNQTHCRYIYPSVVYSVIVFLYFVNGHELF